MQRCFVRHHYGVKLLLRRTAKVSSCPGLSRGWHVSSPATLPPPLGTNKRAYFSSTPLALGGTPPHAPEANLDALEVLKKQKNAVSSLAWLRSIGSALSPEAYYKVLEISREACDAHSALGVLSLMKSQGQHLDVKACTIAIEVCARAGDIDNAERVLSEMKASGLKCSLVNYHHIIHACRRQRNGTKALHMLDHMAIDGLAPDRKAYVHVLGACGAQSLMSEAETLLHRITNGDLKGSVEVDQELCSSLVVGAAENGRRKGWAGSWRAWEVVREHRTGLTAIAFKALRSSLTRTGQYERLLDLCRDLQGALDSSGRSQGLSTASQSAEDVATTGIEACLHLEDHAELKKCVQKRLRQGAFHASVYQEALSAWLALGRWDEMLRLYRDGQEGEAWEDDYLLLSIMATGAARLSYTPMKDSVPFLVNMERRGWIAGMSESPSLPASSISPFARFLLARDWNTSPRQRQTGEKVASGGSLRHDYESKPVHAIVALEMLRRADSRRWQESLQVLRRLCECAGRLEAKGVGVSAFERAMPAFERVISAAVKAGNLEAAKDLLIRLDARGVCPSPRSYNALLYEYARTGQVSDAQTLFEAMCAAGKGRHEDNAAGGAFHGPVPSRVNYNTMLLVLAKTGAFEDAKALVRSMTPPRAPAPDLVSYNTVLAAGTAARDPKGARDFFEEEMVKKRKVRPDEVTYITLLSAWQAMARGYGRSEDEESHITGHVPHASPRLKKDVDFDEVWLQTLALFKDLENTEGGAPNLMAFNIMMDIGCKTGHVDDARSLVLPAMKRHACEPDRVTYNTLAQGYLRGRRYEEALKICRESRVGPVNLGWDSHTYGVMLKALAGLKKDDEMKGLFWERMNALREGKANERASQRTGLPDSDGRHFQDSKRSGIQKLLEEILSAMVYVGRVDDGVLLIRELENQISGPQKKNALYLLGADSFERSVQFCKSTRDLEGALRLLEELERRGERPSAAACFAVMRLCSIKQAWQTGLDVVERVAQCPELSRAMGRDLHTARVSFCAHLNDIAGCRVALREMRKEGFLPDEKVYGWALKCEATRPRNVGGVGELLVQAKEDGVMLTPDVLKAQMATLRQSGNWRGAVQLLDRMVALREQQLQNEEQDGQASQRVVRGTDADYGPQISQVTEISTHIFNDVLATLAQGKEWYQILELQGNMLEKHGVVPDNVSFLYRLQALSETKDWKQALAVLDEIRIGAHGPPVFAQDSMYTVILSGGALDRQPKEIEGLVMRWEKDSRPYTRHFLNALIGAYGRGGQLAKAVDTFNKIPTHLNGAEPDIVAFNALLVAQRLAATPLDEGALPLYRELLSRAPSGLAPDGWTYTSLIVACEAKGAWPVAMYLYDDSAFTLPRAGGAPAAASRASEGEGLEDVVKDAHFKAAEDARGLGWKDPSRTEVHSVWEKSETGTWMGVDVTAGAEYRHPIAGARDAEGNSARFESLKTLMSCLEKLNIGLFIEKLYRDAYQQGVFSPWSQTEGNGRVMDLHYFSCPLATVAIRDALLEFESEQLEQRRLPWGKRKKSMSPWVIIVGQGLKRKSGSGALKKEVLRIFAGLDPPLQADVDKRNTGRLIVPASRIKAYTTARIERGKHTCVRSTASLDGGEQGDSSKKAQRTWRDMSSKFVTGSGGFDLSVHTRSARGTYPATQDIRK